MLSVAMRAQNVPDGGRQPNAMGQSAGGGMANAGPQQAPSYSHLAPILTPCPRFISSLD